MSRRLRSLEHAIAANGQLTCVVCPAQRARLSRFCARHKQKDDRYGSPHGVAYRRFQLDQFEQIADEWLEINEGHPAVVLALKDIADALAYAARLTGGEPRAHQRVQIVLGWLAEKEAKPRTMLRNGLAVMLYNRATDDPGIQEPRAFIQALGKNMIRAVRGPRLRHRHQGIGADSRAVGTWAWQRYKSLLLRAALNIEEINRRDRSLAEALDVPFAGGRRE